MDRRHFLSGIAAGIPLLAGCAGLLETDGGDTETQSNTDTTSTETRMTTAGQTAADQTPTPTSISTPTSTPTPTPTSTPTSTPTPTPTSTPTPMATATPSMIGTTSGPNGAGFGSTKLKTYTSQADSYSIKRPVGWEITTKQEMILFTSTSGFMSIQTIDVPGQANTRSLEPFISKYLKGFSSSFDDFERLGKQKRQLPNNHAGIVVDLSVTRSSTIFRGKALFVLADDTIHVVMLLTPELAYGPSVENGMMNILTSLTITSSGSATPM